MESAPNGKVVVVMEAVADAKPVFGSLLPVTATAGPSDLPPRVNFTEPAGGLPKLEVATVAVSVTLAPCAAIAPLAATVVPVTPLVIVNDTGWASLGRKLESPSNVARMMCTPTVNVLIEFGVRVFPSEFSLNGFPATDLPLSVKITRPVALPNPDLPATSARRKT